MIIILVYGVAYVVRPFVTDPINRVYFLPALTVKIIGALAVGFIYQFYYGGGDTFNYHTYGSRHVWEAFMNSPSKGFKLLFDYPNLEGTYEYSSKIIFYLDPSSYAIVRLASVFDLLTFSSYSATAVLFAVFSFVGMWLFFLVFYERHAHLHKWMAFAAFFIPSVFFWGSGLLKDTITIGCLGFATHAIYKIFVAHRGNLAQWIMLVLSLYGLWSIKIYILLTFLPAGILWIFITNLQYARSLVLRLLLFPFTIGLTSILGYYAIVKAGEDNSKYSLDKLGQTAQITAYDIRYFSGRGAGSGYSLGELDGSIGSMIALAPQAINVSLFRPYLWEVNNPLMLLSALESCFLLIYCIYIITTQNLMVLRAMKQPDIFFSLVFSISFAFAVGVSTFNFGTLVRYKIPMLPFFLIALVLMHNNQTFSRSINGIDSAERDS